MLICRIDARRISLNLAKSSKNLHIYLQLFLSKYLQTFKINRDSNIVQSGIDKDDSFLFVLLL